MGCYCCTHQVGAQVPGVNAFGERGTGGGDEGSGAND